jgi:hypothetical protein
MVQYVSYHYVNAFLPVLYIDYMQAQSEDGRTCLFYASWSGALPVVQYLVETCHININTKNKQDRSALYYACHNGHVDCVAYLLSSGAVKNNIQPSEVAEMPMQYSAFQTQNRVTLPDKSDCTSKAEGTTSSPTDDTRINTDNVHVAERINDLTNDQSGVDTQPRGCVTEDGDSSDTAAIEKVRAAITALIFD